MAFAHPLDVHDAIPRHTQSIPRDTTIPLPLRRVLRQVTVLRESEDKSRAQLRALFNSPVGAYLTGTKVVRDMANVHFGIAPEDLDSTMNTLILTLPRAMIGPIDRCRVTINAH